MKSKIFKFDSKLAYNLVRIKECKVDKISF